MKFEMQKEIRNLKCKQWIIIINNNNHNNNHEINRIKIKNNRQLFWEYRNRIIGKKQMNN